MLTINPGRAAQRATRGSVSSGALLGAAVVLSLAGCPMTGMTGDTGDGGTTTAAVSITNFSYGPREITIQVGQSVRWTNRDAVTHTVTSGNPGDADAGALFNGDLAPGSDFEHTFDTVGEFIYFCIPHQTMASMRGAKVIVTQ